MENNTTSNYKKLCDMWACKFKEMDKEKLMKVLPELKEEEDYFTIYHFGRKFGIHKESGNISAMDDNLPISITAQLNIYTLLGYVSPFAHLKNQWVPFNNLRNTSQFSTAFSKGILEPFAETFTGHLDKLEKAFKSINGKKLNNSDLGYEINAFNCIPIRILFWEKDDEFKAQVNMLFDSSATDFIHEESIVSLAMVALYELARIANLPVSSKAFPTT